MAETWPSTLPQFVNRDGFSYTLSNSAISASMSAGYAKRRKRFTGQYATYSVSIQMTQAQADTFEQFFNNNLGYGVVNIDFPDPLFITSTIEVRIKASKDTNPYSFSPYGDNDEVVLSMELERLISGYSSVSITSWPSTLPSCPLFNNYTNTAQSGIIRDSNYNNGLIDVRRRFTAVTRYHDVSYLFTKDQLVTFFDFYASLGYGAKTFIAPWPINDIYTMKARIDAGHGYAVEYYGDTNLFLVSFIWEELPPVKEWV